jgi:hypothetical protein
VPRTPGLRCPVAAVSAGPSAAVRRRVDAAPRARRPPPASSPPHARPAATTAQSAALAAGAADQALGLDNDDIQSEVGKEYQLTSLAKEGLLDRAFNDSRPNATLLRLQRTQPYYKRNLAPLLLLRQGHLQPRRGVPLPVRGVPPARGRPCRTPPPNRGPAHPGPAPMQGSTPVQWARDVRQCGRPGAATPASATAAVSRRPASPHPLNRLPATAQARDAHHRRAGGPEHQGPLYGMRTRWLTR